MINSCNTDDVIDVVDNFSPFHAGKLPGGDKFTNRLTSHDEPFGHILAASFIYASIYLLIQLGLGPFGVAKLLT